MPNRASICLYAALAGLLLTAAPALAQFQPRPVDQPTIGQRYHIEGFAGLWNPGSTMVISSESLGIPGTTIDFKSELGLTDRRFGDLRLVLRPGRKHKFRFQSVAINYDQGPSPVFVRRDIVFNGQRYSVGVPVNWSLQWKTYRFGYEYDFIAMDRGFGGFIVEAKYTDVTATLAALNFSEFAHAKAPIPAIGGIARVYVVPAISITGEVTGFRLPASIAEGYKAHYADIEIYGMINFTDNVGAQVGWRSVDVGYLIDEDTGSFVVRGLYFGVVARY
jgi:hypothetical protein